jgi:hypothetical protein
MRRLGTFLIFAKQARQIAKSRFAILLKVVLFLAED